MKTIKAFINCMLIGIFFLAINMHAQNSECVIYTINYDFEQPTVPTTSGWPTMEDEADVPGWQTTASDGVIEVWPSSSNGGAHPAYSGNQYIELNANEVSGIYQDYQTPVAGIEFYYSFAHAARDQAVSGEDVVGVYAGPTDVPVDDLPLIAQFSTPINTGWDLKTGSYQVPAGQTTTRFLFKAISTASGNATVGNFLDAIQFSADFGIITQDPLSISCTSSVDVEALGNGVWDLYEFDHPNPSATTFSDPNASETTISGLDTVGEYNFVWTNTDQGCYDILTINVVDGSIPVNTVLASLPSQCDDDGNGTENFDLTSSESTFLDNPTNYDIDYYTSQNSAENEETANKINTPEDYQVQAGNTRTVFLRISNGECHDVVALSLAAYVIPDVIDISDLNTCEDNAGEFKLDLTQNTANIIGNQNPNNISVSYFDNQIDADNGDLANAIPTPEDFQLTGLGCETIFVRVENANHPECYQVVTFQACGIEVNAGMPNELTECTIAEDGLASFNLTQNNDEVLNGENASSYTINYYTSSTDADNADNEIENPSNYKAENQTQTIYVRMENNQDSACYDTASFNIVSTQVTPEPIDAILVCMGDTFNQYNLSDAALNLSQDETVEGYFKTFEDAANNENAIANPEEYTNTLDTETVYITVSNTNEQCLSIYQMELQTESCEVTMTIPKGFSPNGDSYNDVFEIPGLKENYPNYSLEIYSRYGRKVYNGNIKTDYWDGNSEGGEAPTGTYFYMLDLHDGNQAIKGWVYLNR